MRKAGGRVREGGSYHLLSLVSSNARGKGPEICRSVVFGWILQKKWNRDQIRDFRGLSKIISRCRTRIVPRSSGRVDERSEAFGQQIGGNINLGFRRKCGLTDHGPRSWYASRRLGSRRRGLDGVTGRRLAGDERTAKPDWGDSWYFFKREWNQHSCYRTPAYARGRCRAITLKDRLVTII